MRLALLAIAAASVWAQTPDIHGTVLEQGPNTPLAGVEIRLVDFIPVQDTLEERLVATVFTDDRGRFAFKPDKLGEYRVDVRKSGYTADDREQKKVFVILTKDRPVQEFQFSLMNPSHIAGQFLDEQDQPIAGLRIFVQPLQGALHGVAHAHFVDVAHVEHLNAHLVDKTLFTFIHTAYADLTDVLG